MTTRLSIRNVSVAAAVGGVAYLVFLGHRLDYLGHFLAGLGSTLLLLCGFLYVRSRVVGWEAVVVTVVAVGLGFITESSIFRFAFFDPVDFCNQSAGACVACACLLGVPPRRRSLAPLGAVSLGLVAGGFVFAFV